MNSIQLPDKQLYSSIISLSKEMAKSYLTKADSYLFNEAKERYNIEQGIQTKFKKAQSQTQLQVVDQQNEQNESKIVVIKKIKSKQIPFSAYKPQSKNHAQGQTLNGVKVHKNKTERITNLSIKLPKPQNPPPKSLKKLSMSKIEEAKPNSTKTNTSTNTKADDKPKQEKQKSKRKSSKTSKSLDIIIYNNTQAKNRHIENDDDYKTAYDSMLLDLETMTDINTKLSLSLLKPNDAFYQKEKKFQTMKNRKIENMQKIKADKEQLKYYSKPEINIKSKEIMEKKLVEYIPIYERGIQLHSMKQTRNLINEKMNESKAMINKSSRKKMPKKAIDSFISDQFKWKEKLMTDKRIKETFNQIKKEIEIDIILDNGITKRNQSNRMNNDPKDNKNMNTKGSISMVNIPVHNRLYIDHDLRMDKMKLFQKRMKPSFTPEINPYNNKVTNREKKDKVYHFNNKQKSFDLKQRIPVYILNKQSSNIANTSQYKDKQNRYRYCRDRRRDIEKVNQTTMMNKNKQIETNWEIELEASSYYFKNNKHKEKDKKDFGGDKKPSWFNELELVSSAPSSNDCYWSDSNRYNEKDTRLSSKRFYKLNNENTTSTGRLQQVIMCSKQDFKHLLK